MSFLLGGPAQFSEEIRKSRFLAQAHPLSNADQASQLLAELRDAGASHNCWAWKLGTQYRFSDDGEPGGTAGRPILGAIEAQEMDQLIVVVTRWYGGIQLGTGGLARAYGGCANQCLQQAERTAHIPRLNVGCQLNFSELALFKARLDSCATLLIGETYDAQGARLELAVAPAQLDALQRLLSDISRGRSLLQHRD